MSPSSRTPSGFPPEHTDLAETTPLGFMIEHHSRGELLNNQETEAGSWALELLKIAEIIPNYQDPKIEELRDRLEEISGQEFQKNH